MSTFAQDSPILYLFPRVIIKKKKFLFSHSKEKGLGKKNCMINHQLTHIFCLLFISPTRRLALQQMRPVYFVQCYIISALTGANTS